MRRIKSTRAQRASHSVASSSPAVSCPLACGGGWPLSLSGVLNLVSSWARARARAPAAALSRLCGSPCVFCFFCGRSYSYSYSYMALRSHRVQPVHKISAEHTSRSNGAEEQVDSDQCTNRGASRRQVEHEPMLHKPTLCANRRRGQQHHRHARQPAGTAVGGAAPGGQRRTYSSDGVCTGMEVVPPLPPLLLLSPLAPCRHCCRRR